MDVRIGTAAGPLAARRLVRPVARPVIPMRPEERAGRDVDGDHGPRPQRAHEHSVRERRRQSREPASAGARARDHLLHVELGQRLGPPHAAGRRLEHVEADFSLLLDEHVELVPHDERCAEVPTGRRRRPHDIFVVTAGQPPAEPTARRGVVGGQTVSTLPCLPAPPAQTEAAAAEAEFGLAATDGESLRRALDGDDQTVRRDQPATRRIVEHTGERRLHAARGIRRVGVGIQRDRSAIGARGLQPESFAALEVDRQDAQPGAEHDEPVHGERRACRHRWKAAVGEGPPLPLEHARLLGVTCQRDAIPRHEERTARHRDRVASGRPAWLAPVGPDRHVASSPPHLLEPGERLGPGHGRGHIPCPDPYRSREARATQQVDGGLGVAGAVQGDGAHERHGGLEIRSRRRGGDALEPRRGECRFVGLERAERGDERGAAPRGSVKPAPCHGHHARRVIGAERLPEIALRSSAEQELVGFASRRRLRLHRAPRLGLEAPTRRVVRRALQEGVALRLEDLVEERRGVAPTPVGEQLTGPLELPLADPVTREEHSRLVRRGRVSLDGILTRRPCGPREHRRGKTRDGGAAERHPKWSRNGRPGVPPLTPPRRVGHTPESSTIEQGCACHGFPGTDRHRLRTWYEAAVVTSKRIVSEPPPGMPWARSWPGAKA